MDNFFSAKRDCTKGLNGNREKKTNSVNFHYKNGDTCTKMNCATTFKILYAYHRMNLKQDYFK